MKENVIAVLFGVLGWVAANLIGKPVLAMRETIANIAKALIEYEKDDTAVSLTPPIGDDPAEQSRRVYLRLVSELNAHLNTIPFYRLWSLTGLLPSVEKIDEAQRNLIGLSNMSGRPGAEIDNTRRREKIRNSLQLKP